MDIEGGGEVLVAQLVKTGLVRDVADLYSLAISRPHRIWSEWVKNRRSNFLDSIEASKTRDLWRLVFGLGILHVGAGVAKSLGKSFSSLDELQAATEEQLTEIEDVGQVIAKSLVRWFSEERNQKLIERLRMQRLKFQISALSAKSAFRSLRRQDIRADGHAAHAETGGGCSEN